MDEISITISVAGRQYRLKSDEKDKELIEEAARQINRLIRLYAENYAYKDNQDLLAMVTLQETLSVIRKDIEIRETSEGIDKQIALIDKILSDNSSE
jgi:cell division protein ZapA (FtsZ GTPase activity inhibitor)